MSMLELSEDEVGQSRLRLCGHVMRNDGTDGIRMVLGECWRLR